MGKLFVPDVLPLDDAIDNWMRSKGLALVRISETERDLALAHLIAQGDLAELRARRLVALWSLSREASARAHPFDLKDTALFLEAEGFALEDSYGERTLVSNPQSIGGGACPI